MSLTNIKCLVPLFTSSISTPLQDILISTHSLANNSLSSIFNAVHRSGIIAQTSKCFIDYTSKFLNDNPANIVCDNTHTLIDVLKQDDRESRFILEPSQIVNGTMNIMGQEYNITESNESYDTLALNDIVEFLGLQNCSPASVIESLRQWAISQMPTPTTTELPTTINYSQDYVSEDNNWLTQEIDILGAKIPVWSILTAAATTVGLVGVGIGYCISSIKGKKHTENLSSHQQEETELQNITIDSAYLSTQTTPNNSALAYATSDVTNLKAGPEVYEALGIDMMRNIGYSAPIDVPSHEYQEPLLGDHDN
jgi:hypothetical protein